MKISIALLAVLVALGVASPMKELEQSCGGQEALCAGDYPLCCPGYRCIKVSSYLVTACPTIAGGTLIYF